MTIDHSDLMVRNMTPLEIGHQVKCVTSLSYAAYCVTIKTFYLIVVESIVHTYILGATVFVKMPL